jgi:hypothetical protein
MNEVIQTRSGQTVRRHLLLTVSSAAVLILTRQAHADNTDRPTVWVELGGAFDQMSRGSVDWVPPNLTDPISNASPKPFGNAPSMGYDFDGTISLHPNGSDWTFNASLRYGRAQHGPKNTHDQAYPITSHAGLPSYAFLNATQQSHSTHALIDFTAGKDVGMGLLNSGLSTIHFGVRAAQLTENATGHFSAFSTAPQKYSGGKIVHKADALFARSFTGAGPSVSWDGATPLMGSVNDGMTFDWGANAAILVGRQKAHVSLHTADTRYAGKYQYPKVPIVLSQSTVAPQRDRTVVVPNLGGFAGVSWRLPSGKITMGYRADFFFGAIDGGLATAQRNTTGFYGPFASVSIGLGG